VAPTYNNIAVVYDNQGKYEMVLGQYAKSLAIKIKALGEGHPEVATTYSNIAVVYRKQGKYEMALGQYAKCLSIEIKALGEGHPDVAITYGNIAVVYGKQGKHEMALEQYAKGLSIRIKALGEGHPDVATAYTNIGVTKCNMADVLEDQGELARAGGLFRESAAIFSKVHGAEHEDTLDAIKDARRCAQGAA